MSQREPRLPVHARPLLDTRQPLRLFPHQEALMRRLETEVTHLAVISRLPPRALGLAFDQLAVTFHTLADHPPAPEPTAAELTAVDDEAPTP